MRLICCLLLFTGCSDGPAPDADDGAGSEVSASVPSGDATPMSGNAEPSTNPHASAGDLDSSATSAAGTDVVTSSHPTRGELDGATYCEKLDTCCNQVNSGTLPSERESCQRDLAKALEDDSSAERDCWYTLGNNVERLYCGPGLKGTVTVEFEAAHSGKFVCDSSSHGPTLKLHHDSSTASISCPTIIADNRYSNLSVVLPTAVGQHRSDGALPPQGTFMYTDPTGTAHSYTISDAGVFSANVSSFDPATNRLVATTSLEFPSGSTSGSPAAVVRVTIDTELPEPLGQAPARE